MAFQDDEVQTLTRLGLTHWQAKVYLALVQSGTATVKTISNISGVPRQHVYEEASSLQELSLVEKAITSPVKFKAIQLQDGLSILMERKKREYNELQAKIRDLTKRDRNIKAKTTLQEEKTQFVLIPGKESALKIRGKLCDGTQASVDVIDSWRKFPPTVFTFIETHNKMWERGVKSRLIIDRPEDKKSCVMLRELLEYSKQYSHETRYLLKPPPAIVAIHDKTEVIIDTAATTALGESPILWSNNSSILAIVQDYFETMWLTALEEVPEEP